MKIKAIACTLLTVIGLFGCSSQNEPGTYQSKNFGFEFKYPDTWHVKEIEQTILISPDPNFDTDNEMLGQNAPIEIQISNQSSINSIVENYNSTPEKTHIANKKAEQISYEGLGQTFTVISIANEDNFVEIWKNQTTEQANQAFQQIYSSIKF